jgi:hypothetical protein
MKHHTYIGITIFAILVALPTMLVYAVTTNALGGNISKVPAQAISDEENACNPGRKNCPNIPDNTITGCSWTYSIDENKTFDLDADLSVKSAIKSSSKISFKSLFSSLFKKGSKQIGQNATYYIPRTLQSKVGTISKGKNILGLYKDSTVQVGQCIGNYELISPPNTPSVLTKTATVNVAQVVDIWGTSSK